MKSGEAYLVGLMLADGGAYRYVDRRGPNSYHYQIDFLADSSEAYARQVAELVEKEFGIKPLVKKHPKSELFLCKRLYKSSLGKYFRNNTHWQQNKKCMLSGNRKSEL